MIALNFLYVPQHRVLPPAHPPLVAAFFSTLAEAPESMDETYSLVDRLLS